MSKDELKIWFLDKLNLCYSVTYEDYPYSVFLFYSESFVRKIKLHKIIKQDITLPSKVNGICLFEINLRTNMLCCDFKNIWNIMNYNYSNSYIHIQDLITIWLKDFERFCMLTPTYINCIYFTKNRL